MRKGIKLTPTATKFALSPTLAANEVALARRAQGLPVLHMGFGESPFPVPPVLENALQAAAHRKDYLACAGDAKLREVAANYYHKKIGLDTTKYDVVVAPGSKLILYALQMAIEGDLLMPVPSWVSYAPQALMLHTQLIKVPTTLDDGGYHIDAATLRQTIRSARGKGLNPRKIILNSPNNPTGLVIPETELKAIAEVLVEEDIFIISDEIYGMVNFSLVDTARSAEQPQQLSAYQSISHYAPENTAISTGLSKHLSLGGWRLGIGFVPKSIDGLHGLIANIASETWSCVPSPITQAAIVAYSLSDQVEGHTANCSAIHNLMNQYLSEGIATAGTGGDSSKGPYILCPMVQGAFYNYPNFNHLRTGLKEKFGIETSQDLAKHLADTYGLIALPGVAFGEEQEQLTLRLSGCDYDGSKALAAYEAGDLLNESFVAKHAPHLVEQVFCFNDLVVATLQ